MVDGCCKIRFVAGLIDRVTVPIDLNPGVTASPLKGPIDAVMGFEDAMIVDWLVFILSFWGVSAWAVDASIRDSAAPMIRYLPDIVLPVRSLTYPPKIKIRIAKVPYFGNPVGRKSNTKYPFLSDPVAFPLWQAGFSVKDTVELINISMPDVWRNSRLDNKILLLLTIISYVRDN